jgi:hypothetical protein
MEVQNTFTSEGGTRVELIRHDNPEKPAYNYQITMLYPGDPQVHSVYCEFGSQANNLFDSACKNADLKPEVQETDNGEFRR